MSEEAKEIRLIDNIKSVREVIDDIVSEADELLGRLNGLLVN